MIFFTSFVLGLTVASATLETCGGKILPERDRTSEVLEITNAVLPKDELLWTRAVSAAPGGPLYVALIGQGAGQKGNMTKQILGPGRKSNLAKQIAGLKANSRIIKLSAHTPKDLRRGYDDVKLSALLDEPALIVLNVTLHPQFKPNWPDATAARTDLVRLGFTPAELELWSAAYLISR